MCVYTYYFILYNRIYEELRLHALVCVRVCVCACVYYTIYMLFHTGSGYNLILYRCRFHII